MNIPEQCAKFADNMIVTYGPLEAFEQMDRYISYEHSPEAREMLLTTKHYMYELITLHIYMIEPTARVKEMFEDNKDIFTTRELLRQHSKNDQDVYFRIIGTGDTMKCGDYWKACLAIAEYTNPEKLPVVKDPTDQTHQTIKDFFKYKIFLGVKGLFFIMFVSLFSIAFSKHDAYILMQSLACLFAATVVHFFSTYIKNTFNE